TLASCMRDRRSFSMSSTLSPCTEMEMSCAPRPVICSTADTRPAANSPWPATIARACAGVPGGASLLMSLIVLLQVLRHVPRCTHLAHQSFVEPLGGIDAAVLEQMVHRDDFRDDRDVLARVERHADFRKLDVQDRGHLSIETCALDGGVLM